MPEDEQPKQPPPAPQQQRQEQPLDGILAEVVEVVKVRTGIYGEIRQGMCRILEGPDKGRVIRRNIAGKLKVGDRIRLPDSSREDKPIRAR